MRASVQNCFVVNVDFDRNETNLKINICDRLKVSQIDKIIVSEIVRVILI